MTMQERALDILLECVTGQREVLPLLFAIAKISPPTLVAAVDYKAGPPVADWVRRAYNYREGGNKTEAIKELRMARNLGLKEAVDLMNKYIMGAGLEAFRDIVDPVPF